MSTRQLCSPQGCPMTCAIRLPTLKSTGQGGGCLGQRIRPKGAHGPVRGSLVEALLTPLLSLLLPKRARHVFIGRYPVVNSHTRE